MNTRKNIIWLLIIAVCIICLGGCAKKEQKGTPVEISYLNKSETKIVTEQHYLEGTTTKEMIVEVLTLLCSVPENKELKATLSGGINIINYSLDGGQVTVSLGEKYKELSKTDRSFDQSSGGAQSHTDTGCWVCDDYNSRRAAYGYGGQSAWNHDSRYVR